MPPSTGGCETEVSLELTWGFPPKYHRIVQARHSTWIICLVAAFFPVSLVVSPCNAFSQDSEQALADRIASEIDSGQIDSALQRARDAVSRYPQSSQLSQLLGAAAFKKGLNEEARAAFRRAIDLEPGASRNYYDLALVYLSESRYTLAVPLLENSIRLEPADAQGHLLLGRAYHNLNQTLPAVEQFKKALSLSPNLPLAHYHLGFAYQSEGNLKSALTEFRREIETNPRFYDSYWLAGNIELRQSNLDVAQDLFARAIEVRPAGYQAHYGLGRVFLARKQLQLAEAELKRAVEVKPQDVEAHYALAQTYRQMGDRDGAGREFRICAELNARTQKVRSGIAGVQP